MIRAKAFRALLLAFPLVTTACSAPKQSAQSEAKATPVQGTAEGSGLTSPAGPALVLSVDLVEYVMAAPFSKANRNQMERWDQSSIEWKAARGAALAWAAADFARFTSEAKKMGYAAVQLKDRATGHKHWVLRDNEARYQGVFVFRAPEEVKRARPIVIDAPHRGFDFNDGRAARLYREVNAVAFLQNTADRCNASACSGCSPVQHYACGGTCPRASDVAHSVEQAYYAVYDGLESVRDDLHFEYHGAGESSAIEGCSGTAHISQASKLKLTAEQDDGSYPNRFWNALRKRLGDHCVCYHQRQTGCRLNGAASAPGRRTNSEAVGSDPSAPVCTQSPAALAKRFVHFEGHKVKPDDVIVALEEATR